MASLEPTPNEMKKELSHSRVSALELLLATKDLGHSSQPRVPGWALVVISLKSGKMLPSPGPPSHTSDRGQANANRGFVKRLGVCSQPS